ncbi:hypothetical protein C7M84_011898 [Penaeus vannamei]|uniref:Uncharacterized protein n=1 Tax=Penaeus vannamei TaxID=6689 RepID=A0A3R7PFE1_PENVA|nr:hypothetical protein C7M84_011898 [Penaeus vannamei]
MPVSPLPLPSSSCPLPLPSSSCPLNSSLPALVLLPPLPPSPLTSLLPYPHTSSLPALFPYSPLFPPLTLPFLPIPPNHTPRPPTAARNHPFRLPPSTLSPPPLLPPPSVAVNVSEIIFLIKQSPKVTLGPRLLPADISSFELVPPSARFPLHFLLSLTFVAFQVSLVYQQSKSSPLAALLHPSFLPFLLFLPSSLPSLSPPPSLPVPFSLPPRLPSLSPFPRHPSPSLPPRLPSLSYPHPSTPPLPFSSLFSFYIPSPVLALHTPRPCPSLQHSAPASFLEPPLSDPLPSPPVSPPHSLPSRARPSDVKRFLYQSRTPMRYKRRQQRLFLGRDTELLIGTKPARASTRSSLWLFRLDVSPGTTASQRRRPRGLGARCQDGRRSGKARRAPSKSLKGRSSGRNTPSDAQLAAISE